MSSFVGLLVIMAVAFLVPQTLGPGSEFRHLEIVA
jgi:hypothetical protein